VGLSLITPVIYKWVLTAAREVLLGIAGKDFVILAASKAAMRGPTVLKAEDDKTRQLNKNTLMAFSGESGDTGMPLLRRPQ
jgi:20S proteasome alpha/beta subunit